MPRLLTLMGSGETAPTMAKVHRELVVRVGGPAVLLDTPYGFQENAPELAERAQRYFRDSVGAELEVAGLGQLEGLDPVALEQGLNRVRAGHYLFAGPGSPTYALRQWRGTPLAALLLEKLARSGAVTFASAAALTLGRVTVPVYEIYKAGEPVRWEDGLDVLGPLGLPVAVIPHYDNAEGGHHDTRFCYLGERRLTQLEAELPPGHHVLGIDEHTAVVLDLDADTATVHGHGGLTVRVRGQSQRFESGSVLPIDHLREPGRAHHSPPPLSAPRAEEQATPGPQADEATSLGEATERCQAVFDTALADADAAAAVGAVLELETAITLWSADTLQSDEGDRARAALRSMITRLGGAATAGLRDPRQVVGPFVDALLDARVALRTERLYALGDNIRDRLGELGVEVQDTPAGAQWELAGPPG